MKTPCKVHNPRIIHSRHKIVNILNHTVKVLVINFQSLKSKKELLLNLIDSSDPDVIIGTESWLNPNIYSSEYFPIGYNVYRKDREDSYGGVLLAIKSDITSQHLEINGNCEVVAAKILLTKTNQLIIMSVYRPPSSNLEYANQLGSIIEDIAHKNNTATLWIGSDLNLPDINWENCFVSGHTYTKSISENLLGSFINSGLDQAVKFSTRGNSILDIFLTNRPTLIQECESLPPLGDHDIVYIVTAIQAHRQKPTKRRIQLWNKANLGQMRQDTEQFSQNFCVKYDFNSNIPDMWNDIKTFHDSNMNKNVPSKISSSRFNQPWINRQLKQLSRQKKRAYRKAKQSGKDRDLKCFKMLKSKMQQQCRQVYKKYIDNIINPDNNNNSKRLWSSNKKSVIKWA